MIINTAGEYTLQYTATDACGNSTTVERNLVVDAPPRTVLYTDGTFIINELGTDQAANTALHGQPTNVYAPFDPNGATNADKYIFSASSSRPWYAKRNSVKSVEIGSEIHPTSTAYWFNNFTTCESIDLTNLDTSAVTNMNSMFYYCQALTSLDVSGFNTSAVTGYGMYEMFADCQALTSLDVSGFDTSAVTGAYYMFADCQALTSLDVSGFDTSAFTETGYMFSNCQALTTIYVSPLFVTTHITGSTNMFNNCSSLVGGAGTVYDSSHINKTYARIDNPPDAPGYFTAKS